MEASDAQQQDILAEYRRLTELDKDDDLFVRSMLRISRTENLLSELGDDFQSQTVSGYEALSRLNAILAVMQDIKEEVYKGL
jgi:hypothetical protein